MRTNRNSVNRMLRMTAILGFLLLPVSAIAAESSVNEQLLRAAENGSVEQIKTLLEKGGDVNAKALNGEGALSLAQKSGDKQMEELLKAHGAFDKERNFFGQIGNYSMSMRLEMAKRGNVKGNYAYDKYYEEIPLRGEISGSNILLNVYDDAGSILEIFDGKYIDHEINGIWKHRGKALKFHLVEEPPDDYFHDAEKEVWRRTIHPSIGIVEFKYEGEENGISVRTLRDNKQLQNIPVSIYENGSIQFLDLDGDGNQDVVIYRPDYPGGSPIPNGQVWIFCPKDKIFKEVEDISDRGEIEKAKERGCLILTYRNSWTKSPFYIGEYWCFDRASGVWKHKKNFVNRFSK